MRGLQLLDQLEHVIVLAADDAVTPQFGGIRGGERDGDGVAVHIQAEEQGWAGRGVGGGSFRGGCQRSGPGILFVVLRLDSFRVTQ